MLRRAPSSSPGTLTASTSPSPRSICRFMLRASRRPSSRSVLTKHPTGGSDKGEVRDEPEQGPQGDQGVKDITLTSRLSLLFLVLPTVSRCGPRSLPRKAPTRPSFCPSGSSSSSHVPTLSDPLSYLTLSPLATQTGGMPLPTSPSSSPSRTRPSRRSSRPSLPDPSSKSPTLRRSSLSSKEDRPRRLRQLIPVSLDPRNTWSVRA